MLTKTQHKIIQIFVSKLNKKFSINEISLLLKKPYALIYNSIKELIEMRLITIDERKLLSINLEVDTGEFVYAEHLRIIKRLEKYKSISLFIQDCKKEINEDFFILLFFGSFVEKDTFKDIDILFIVDDEKIVENSERLLNRIASNFSFKAHILVISKESVYEMFKDTNKINVINETLNKHLIIFGAENYYRILKNARR